MWLLRATTVAVASTYAYVNPVVTVLLGWAVLDEEITVRALLAMVIVVAAVALVTYRPACPSRPAGPARARARRPTSGARLRA